MRCAMQEERAISPVGTLEYMAPETVKLPPAEFILNGEMAAPSTCLYECGAE